MANEIKYANLIRRAIKNFDEIYTVMYNKGVGWTVEQGSTGVKTDDYANVISKKLWAVAGSITPNTVSDTDGHQKIANKTGAQTAEGLGLNYETKTIEVSGLNSGYYDGTSKISVTKADMFKDVTWSSFAPVKDTEGKVTHYELTPSNGTILSKVTVNSGELVVKTNLTPSTENKPTVVASHELEAKGTLAISDSAIDNGYSFTITDAATLSGKLTSTLDAVNSTTLTPGYITADDITFDNSNNSYDLSALSLTNDAKTYYIAKGSVKFKSIETDGAQITLDSELATTTDAGKGYAVNASVAKPTIKVQTTAGYVEAADAVDISPTEWNADAKTQYIKAGKVQAHKTAIDNTAVVTNLAAGMAVGAANAEKVSIKVSNNAITVTPKLDEGYIKAKDVESTTIAATEQYINIDKAAATATVSADVSLTDGNSVLDSTGYEVSLKVTPTVTKTVTGVGYLSDADQLTTNSGTALDPTTNAKIYIKQGSITTSAAIDFADIDPNNGEYPDNISRPLASDLFFTDLKSVAGRDYYTISAKATNDFSEGYIKTAQATVRSTPYYLPRASLKYVEDSTAGNFIQVEKSGYLPSGALLEITEITGKLDEAAVVGTLTPEAGVSLKLGTSISGDVYVLNIGKGATTEAGYISAEQGTVSGTYYLGKGKAETTVACTDLSVTEIAKVEGEAAYTVSLSSTAKVKTNITEGYIKAEDLKINGSAEENNTDVSYTHEHDIVINEAVVELKSNNVSGDVQATGVEFVDSSAYSVAPKLSGAENGAASLTVGTKTEGYIGADYSKEISVALGTSTTRYIKAGTANSSVNGKGNVKVTTDLATTKEGDYVISLDGTNEIAVSGTLESGYYGSAAERALAGKASVEGLTGQVSIAHGNLSVTGVSSKISINSQNGLVLAKDVQDVSNYYSISALSEGLTIGKSFKEGYIKETDYDASKVSSVTNTDTTKYYIKKYSEVTTMPVGETKELAYTPFGAAGFGVVSATEGDNTVATAQDVAYIDVKESYSDKQIAVTLHADACGSNVRDLLADLEARLNGDEVSIVAMA